MTELSDADWEKLTRELSSRVAVFTPDWTEHEDSDPGITLIQLFGFLTESLLFRADLSPEARTHLRLVLDRLERAPDSTCQDGTLTRNSYFTGKQLTADDFEQEQSYHRSKHRRHNRLLHGVGIVSGLGVSVEPGSEGDDASVVVSPGVAIAPDGEELVVCERAILDVCAGKSLCYVTVALTERPENPTPSGEASRIQETAEVAVSEDAPAGHLAIARLLRDGDGWLVDAAFEPARSGQPD
jgi:hypothetical protein